MIKISIYKVKDFKKDGTLKKNARTEYQTEKEKMNMGEMADYLKYLGYTDFQTPYFFTHIKAVSPYDKEEVKIFQDVSVSGHWFVTSPQELITHLV